MKKNLYYRTVLRRRNPIMELLVTVFLSIASWPRMLLEVFIRRNFGERYFSFTLAIIIAIILASGPLIAASGVAMLFGGKMFANYLADNLSWFLYLVLFICFSYIRREEIKRKPSVFDFGRFSLSAGEHLPIFYQFTYNGKLLSPRTIEIIIEPAIFFILGCVFTYFNQFLLGPHLIACSIIYSLSYVAAYYNGDNFVMDKIDEIICNEDLYDAFVEGVDPRNTRGVSFYGRRPADPDARRKAYDGFFEEDKDPDLYDAI